MGKPRPATPAMMFVGLLSGDRDLLRRARQLLVRAYGPLALESDFWPFTETDYYQAEMGPNLLRSFLAFEQPMQPDRLAPVKLECNALEERIARDCADPIVTRPVNIDPGYLDLGKVVLATTKDRSHRIYLSAGIFAEVTLHYSDHAWRPWPWTYPDYQHDQALAFFRSARQALQDQRRAAAVVRPADGAAG